MCLSLSAFGASLCLRFAEPSFLLTGLFLQGLAVSSLVTVLILTLLELPQVSERHAGVASGMFFSASQFGGVLGPFTLGLLYVPGAGFNAGLVMLAVISLSIAAGAILLSNANNRSVTG